MEKNTKLLVVVSPKGTVNSVAEKLIIETPAEVCI
jgi:hypothetical protein